MILQLQVDKVKDRFKFYEDLEEFLEKHNIIRWAELDRYDIEDLIRNGGTL